MSQSTDKIQNSDFAAIRPLVGLSTDASAVLANVTKVPDALQRLETNGFLIEAARVVAHALPKREAVWWACMCALHTEPPDLPESDRLARELAENWVRQQTDKVRREAMAKAEVGKFATPEAWTAVAAFWSGDSMAPEGQQAVPPAPHLCGAAVAGAVVLAAVRGDPTRQGARLKRFLESGRNIAAGGPGRMPHEEA